MKRAVGCLLAFLLALSLFAGCGKKDDGIVVVGASVTPHAEILEVANEVLREEGSNYQLEIKEFDDYIIPNTSIESGDLDANYFQHQNYLDDFNAKNDTHLVSVANIHYEPYGIYAGRRSALTDMEGAEIAVPNDTSNEARALMLLESQGIIKLKEGAGLEATARDIEENPHNVKIVELTAASITRMLEDVDFAVINGNYAIQAGLSVTEDALAIEDKQSVGSTTFVNVLVVKEGHEKDPGILALCEALQSDKVRSFIEENYGGAVIPVF